MKKQYAIALAAMAISAQLGAQSINPAYNEAFVQSEVTRIDLEMDPADLAWMLEEENLENEDYLGAVMSYVDSEGDTIHFDSVGVRLRGNTSRYAKKKSFKIHMEKFGGVDLFYDLEKVNLKGSHNDPSILRERLAYHVMREMNGAAARCNNVELYINGAYRGLYVNFEQIDNDFMKSRFGNKSGNLYKCLYGASLRTTDDVWNNEVFELETNEEENDRSDLIYLISKLNNTSDAVFESEIEQVLDIDHLLKYLAVEVLVGHWDGYSFNKNNYYLYHNDSTDKFEVVMYDPDNTFGIDWFGINWATRDLYDWGSTAEDRPMFWRILSVPAYRAQYTENLRYLLNGPFHPDQIFPIIDAWHTQNAGSALADPYYPLDYGFDSSAYVLSTSQAWGAHVKWGIKPYIEARHASALAQLDYPFAVNEATGQTSALRYSSRPGLLQIWSDSDQTIGELKVYNVTGSLIADLSTAAWQKGRKLELHLTPGCYVLVCTSDGKTPESIKLMVP